jgi:hypothetical protein
MGVAHFITKVPLREFDVPWKRYYTAYEINNYSFVAVTCGITSIQNFSNFSPFIPLIDNSRLSTSFAYGADKLDFGRVGI